MKKTCVTGPRTQNLCEYMDYNNFMDKRFVNYLFVQKQTVERLVSLGYNHFITGGAVGVDLDFAKAVIEYKEKHNGSIFLEVAVPCLNQQKFYNFNDKQKYNEVLHRADYVTILYKNYTSYCMQKRNEYMVDSSELVVAF